MARFDDKKLQTDNLVDKLVSINRVSKTVKGGRNMSFAALVVVGDKAGRVGFGKGKALEVQSAVQKATKAAKAKMIRVPLKEGRTLHHDISAKYGASKLVVRSEGLLQVVRCVLCLNAWGFRTLLLNPRVRTILIT